MQSIAVHESSCQIHKLLNKKNDISEIKARNKKPMHIWIYETVKGTVKLRKKFWKKVKDLCSQNKYLVLVYDEIYARDSCLPYNNKV